MLKRKLLNALKEKMAPAAFRRLCVETSVSGSVLGWRVPAAFRRLCVETGNKKISMGDKDVPAAFRRLCVETGNCVSNTKRGSQPPSGGCVLKHPSRTLYQRNTLQPPSGGCVLKPTDWTPAPEDVEASRLQAAVC